MHMTTPTHTFHIFHQIADLRVEEEAFAARPRGRRRRRHPLSNSSHQQQQEQDGGQEQEEEEAEIEQEEEPLSVASAVLSKYRRCAFFVTGDSDAGPEDIAPWMDARLLDKNIPPLFQFGLRPELVPVALAELENGMGGAAFAPAAAGRRGREGSLGFDATRLKAILERETARGRVNLHGHT